MPTHHSAKSVKKARAVVKNTRAVSVRAVVKNTRTASSTRNIRGVTTFTTVVPAKKSRETLEELSEMLKDITGPELVLSRGERHVEITRDLVDILESVAAAVERSSGVTVIISGSDATLSSQEAADMLNVSRPFMVKLAKTGQISSLKVGTHHRFSVGDVAEFSKRLRAEQREALRELAPADGYTSDDF